MRVGMRCCGQNDRSEFHCVGGEMIKYEIIDLHKIAIIGKEGLCTKEKNVVQDLWQQANSNFRWFFCWILGSDERRDAVFFAMDGRLLEGIIFGRC